MFRKNKKENKTKLEHKLYLARESPEPVFDLSECDLRSVPSGIFSLCRVFLKQTLQLQHNCLSSLSGGGSLRDLHLLKILDISDNAFLTIPDDISFLTNLIEFHLRDNQIKKLPLSICHLKKLQILDISNNALKSLPENIGDMINLRKLKIVNNKSLNSLPKSICKAQRLKLLEGDCINFVYPPAAVMEKGTEFVIKYICDDTGYAYVGPDETEDIPEAEKGSGYDTHDDGFQAKIWELEKIKQQKLQEFLEIEKHNELMQRQELELASTLKANKQKFLNDLTQQQYKLDKELAKLQQEKDFDRFRLIEQLQEVEQNADRAIIQLLSINKEPLIQLLEQEQEEEQRLLAAASRYNETLRKNDILNAMQELLKQETERFRQFDENRAETTRSVLERELEVDSYMASILHDQSDQKAELVAKLLESNELQKAAVGALLERGDARSWGLIQQVRLVESQLAALTTIELDRKKLEIDEQVSDLAQKRVNLSYLLMDLLEQQTVRRSQLLSTLKAMEDYSGSAEDFWLRQYQQILDRMPSTLVESQKNMDPDLAQTLLMAGAIHCLPFLAQIMQTADNLTDITEEQLKNAGVSNPEDRSHILDAFKVYSKQEKSYPPLNSASAPLPIEEASASAPPLEHGRVGIVSSECVICMDVECEIIFVPCGHLCCCINCSKSLIDCPLCRQTIDHKIRVVYA